MRYASSSSACASTGLILSILVSLSSSGTIGSSTGSPTTAVAAAAFVTCPSSSQQRSSQPKSSDTVPQRQYHNNPLSHSEWYSCTIRPSTAVRYQQRPEEDGGFHRHNWAKGSPTPPPHNHRNRHNYNSPPPHVHHNNKHRGGGSGSSSSSSSTAHPYHSAEDTEDASFFDIDAETTMEDLARQWKELHHHNNNHLRHHNNNRHPHTADPLIKPWHQPRDPHARLPRSPTATHTNNPNPWANYMTASEVQWVQDPEELQARLDQTKPIQPPPPSADDLASVAAHLQQTLQDVTPAPPHAFGTYMAIIDGSSNRDIDSGTVIDIDAHSHCGHLPRHSAAAAHDFILDVTNGKHPETPLPPLQEGDTVVPHLIHDEEFHDEPIPAEYHLHHHDEDDHHEDEEELLFMEDNGMVDPSPPLQPPPPPHYMQQEEEGEQYEQEEHEEPTVAELTEALTSMTQDEADPNHYATHHGMIHEEEVDMFVNGDQDESTSSYAPPYWVVDRHHENPRQDVVPPPPPMSWGHGTMEDNRFESSPNPPPSSNGYHVEVTAAASRPSEPVPEPEPPISNGYPQSHDRPLESVPEPQQPVSNGFAESHRPPAPEQFEPPPPPPPPSNGFAYQSTRPPEQNVEPIYASSNGFFHSTPPPPPPPEAVSPEAPTNGFAYRSSRPPEIVEPPKPPPPPPPSNGFAHAAAANSRQPTHTEPPLVVHPDLLPDISPTQILGPTMEELAEAWARMTRDHVNEPPTMEDLAEAWARLKLEKEDAVHRDETVATRRNHRHRQEEFVVPHIPPNIELQDLADLWTERNREKNIYVGSTSYLDTKDNESKQIYFSSPSERNGRPTMPTWKEKQHYDYSEEPVPQPNPWSSDTPSHTSNNYQYNTGHQTSPPPTASPREMEDLFASWAKRSQQQNNKAPHHHQVMDADRIGRRRGNYRDIDGLAPDKQM